MALVTVISNLILLVALRLKVIGYTASLVLATSISVLFLYLCIRKRIEVKPLQIDKNMQKKMLKYSLPIVPNSTMWWLVNSSTRYCILYFVGVSANGLFAVANRIIKPFTRVWLERSYYDSWKLVPVLLLAVIFQSLNIFFGAIYTASKKPRVHSSHLLWVQ
jgi:O-antigen/teichoic acid export membrane protein